jgi:tetratricopeptide (TPR) repeat protein
MLVGAVAANRAPREAIDQAVPLLNQAIALRADYPDAQIALANVARIRNDEATATSALRSLLANHPEHPEANYTLGLILLPKQPAEALTCFERGERQAPNDADYPRSKARALLALGRAPEARAAIQRAKELAPNDARIDQVASEIASNNPTAKTMTFVIRAIVAVVLLGTLAFVAVFVLGAMKAADAAKQSALTPPTPTASAVTPPAPTTPSAPAPAHESPKKPAPPHKKTP